MNKKGQSFLLAILVGIMIYIFGMLVLNHIMPEVTLARTVGLDCTGDISDGTKITCLGVDMVIPVLIITIVTVAAGSILSRFLI
jgi:hypothetical protein